MRMVYHLSMIDEELSYDHHIEAFSMGLFSSYDQAKKTAERYLTKIAGFKDYPITYQITEKRVIGDSSPAEIFIVYGWNVNGELDEIDVIESDCYVNQNEAEQKLNELKSSYCRKEWCIDQYIIDECSWQEGFERM